MPNNNNATEIIQIDPPEASRTYHYADGLHFTIKNVTGLCVRPSGNHRIEADGKKYIVLSGFIAIEIDTPAWTL